MNCIGRGLLGRCFVSIGKWWGAWGLRVYCCLAVGKPVCYTACRMADTSEIRKSPQHYVTPTCAAPPTRPIVIIFWRYHHRYVCMYLRLKSPVYDVIAQLQNMLQKEMDWFVLIKRSKIDVDNEPILTANSYRVRAFTTQFVQCRSRCKRYVACQSM